ncbi:MAG: hypothetical protein LW832_00650 [Parachlamydia sp.]|nr:hypothetical protein [Parachlamydia sp.]
MGFFTTVNYPYNESKNKNLYEMAEQAAHVLRTPSKWLAADLFRQNTSYEVSLERNGLGNDLLCLTADTSEVHGFKKALRTIVSLATFVFGELLAAPLMSIAFQSEEIRLKHKYAVSLLTDEQYDRLKELISARQNLENERQGCEPVSICLLSSICCLLCCLVCCRR